MGYGGGAIVAGGGDNAAGAVGVGMVDAIRQCYRWGRRESILLSAKGSKQARKRRTQLLPCATAALALMSVMLSAASCLDWAAKLTG